MLAVTVALHLPIYFIANNTASLSAQARFRKASTEITELRKHVEEAKKRETGMSEMIYGLVCGAVHKFMNLGWCDLVFRDCINSSSEKKACLFKMLTKIKP